MAAKAKDKAKGVNPDLEKAIADKLKSVMKDDSLSLTDWAKVVDRALTLEKVKAAIEDEGFGSAFEE